MTQGIKEQIGTLPAIEAELHLIQVGLEMLCADVVPRSHDSTLQEREAGLGSIRVNQPVDVLFLVADRLVRLPLFPVHCEGIDRRFVRDNHFYVLADMVPENLTHCWRFGFTSASMNQMQFSAALADTEHNLLLMARHPLAGFSANIGFVNFYRAVQHLFRFFHGATDTVAEIPSCFVTPDSKSPLNLAGRHSLLGFAEKQDRQKPLGQR